MTGRHTNCPYLLRHIIASMAGVTRDAGPPHMCIPILVCILGHGDHHACHFLGIERVLFEAFSSHMAVITTLIGRNPLRNRRHKTGEFANGEVAEYFYVLINIRRLWTLGADRRYRSRDLIGCDDLFKSLWAVYRFHTRAAIASLHGFLWRKIATA